MVVLFLLVAWQSNSCGAAQSTGLLAASKACLWLYRDVAWYILVQAAVCQRVVHWLGQVVQAVVIDREEAAEAAVEVSTCHKGLLQTSIMIL